VCERWSVIFSAKRRCYREAQKGRVFCSFVAAIEGQSERDEARARQVYLLKRDE
jgi:hypothetical protein